MREYNEEQKKLQTSVRLRSLELVEYYLSMAYDYVEYDREMTSNEDEPQQLSIVESFLRSPYNRPPDIRIHIIDQLQKESTFVRSYVTRIELVDNLRSIIDKMQILY